MVPAVWCRFGYALLASALAASLVAGPATAAVAPARSEASSTVLPTPRSQTSAVWTGSKAFIFGGLTSTFTDEILEFTPNPPVVSKKAGLLPSARGAASAVWDGRYAYVFGGLDGLLVDEILRYDPESDDVDILPSALPSARSETSAVWTGEAAYVFGGWDGLVLKQVVRFDPSTGEVRPMNATLPVARSRTAAVWTGDAAYIFGGGSDSTRILRYDPERDTVTVMGALLPSPRKGAAAVWDGHFAYILGGEGTGNIDEIVRYDPVLDNATVLGLVLKNPRREAGYVWGGDAAYLFGGCCLNTQVTDQILRFRPANAQPEPTFSWAVAGLTLQVNSTGSHDPDGWVSRLRWVWGDSSEQEGPAAASHTYASAGTYRIQLRLTDDRQLTSVVETEIHVEAPAVNQNTGGAQSRLGTQTEGSDDGSSENEGSVTWSPPADGGGDDAQARNDVGWSGNDVVRRTSNDVQSVTDSASPNSGSANAESTNPFDPTVQAPHQSLGNRTVNRPPQETPGPGPFLTAMVALAFLLCRRPSRRRPA